MQNQIGARTPLSVTVFNPYIPLGAYRAQLALALECIGKHVSHREFEALVYKKLRLEDPAPSEQQYLQAAVELTVCAHYALHFPEGFVYEYKVMPPRDVDCSFQSEGFRFNVEVKCADFSAKHQVDESGAFIIKAIGRLSDYYDAVAKLTETFASGGNVLRKNPHMDNKLKTYLVDAHGKFPAPTRQGQFNVLVIGCDDAGDMQQWEGYLTGPRGLFTQDSYADPEQYSNVDLVVISNLYHRHKSPASKDKLSDHWTFGQSFCLLYRNPRSIKPNSMLQAFAKTLRFFNNDLAQHEVEGDAPAYLKERLAIRDFVGRVLMKNGEYFFQPGHPQKRAPSQES